MGAFKSLPKRVRRSENEEYDYRQQIVLFTGSSEKLAMSYALRLASDAERRFKVLVAVSSLSSGENLSDTKILKYLNTTLFMLQMDIASQGDVQKVVDRIKEEDGYIDAVGPTGSAGPSAVLPTMPRPTPPSGSAGQAMSMVMSITVVFLYIGIYSLTRKTSGGHLNPIISLVQMARGDIHLILGACYCAAHLAGATLGAVSVKGITTAKPDSRAFDSFFGAGHAIFAEMMGTSIVVLAYLTLARQGKGNAAILGIGFGYAGALLSVNTASRGFLNPVLNFGISVAIGDWTKHYVYWVGTSLGGILATLLHGMLFASDDQLWIKPRHYIPERIA